MKKNFFALSLASLLLSACSGESFPELMGSPAVTADGQITGVEITVSQNENSSSSNEGAQDPSSSDPVAPPATPPVTPPVAPEEPEYVCVPPMEIKYGLISVRWEKRNGDDKAIEIAVAPVAEAAEKLSKLELNLQKYKELLRTGWGNMQLKVALCEDADKNGSCSEKEIQQVLLSVRAPNLINSGKQGPNHSSGDSDSEESVEECSLKDISYSVSGSLSSERSCHIKINKRNAAPLELKLKF